ncbi:MAG: hypothetical protein LKG27_01290 [Clostridiaceae bacterium]|jgi:hypothetical protein|nr:hypothetical protein [Clostridiaceae bacterium]
MQVNAINSVSTNFTGRKDEVDADNFSSQDRPMSYDEMQSADKQRSRYSHAMRNYAMAGVLGLASMGAVTSCSPTDVDVNHIHNIDIKCPVDICQKGDTVYIKEYVPGETVYKTDTIVKNKIDTVLVPKVDTVIVTKPGKNDTILVPVPGKTDTITVTKHDTTYIDKPIYIPGDTVYVQPDFKSDVADTINTDFGDIGINPDGSGIPISMVYYDEYETMANRLMFNGEESSKNRLIYDETKKGWYGDQHYMRVEFSLNAGPGRGLIMRVKKSRTDGTKPVSDLDWVDFKTYMFRRNGKNQLVKYEVNDGVAKQIGIVRQGDKPKSVLNDYKLSNGETQTFRYSDISVKNHNLKYDQLYSDYLKKLAESEGE